MRNTGSSAGDEVVQLYIGDDVASVTRVVKDLKGFQWVALQPGEGHTVRFEVPVQSLGFYTPALEYIVEPGRFTAWIGPDSARGLEARFLVRA